MQHAREAFERWTSILNRDSAADHQLISDVYLIIFSISCANAIPKSSDTTDGSILHNHVFHCQDMPSSSVQASFIMQIQMKQINSRKCRFFFGFGPGSCSHPDLRLMGNFSLDLPLEPPWGFRKASVEHCRLPVGWPWTGYQAHHQCGLTGSGQQPRGIMWWQRGRPTLATEHATCADAELQTLRSCSGYTARSPPALELNVWLQLPNFLFVSHGCVFTLLP